jgi:hypothetical protein
MNIKEQKSRMCELLAHQHSCCRCDSPADRFTYGAFFCSEECADRCGDFALDDGAQRVRYLDEIEFITKAIQDLLDEKGDEVYRRYYDELKKIVSRRAGKKLAQYKMMFSTPDEYREALLKTFDLWT